MKVEYQQWIYRADLRNNPDKIYLFGDNLAQEGYGGQAFEMRGEPNAIGIPTKKFPSSKSSAFFSDEEFVDNCRVIDEAFAKIPKDKIVVIPKRGLGVGYAALQKYAPKTLEYLNNKLQELKK